MLFVLSFAAGRQSGSLTDNLLSVLVIVSLVRCVHAWLGESNQRADVLHVPGVVQTVGVFVHAWMCKDVYFCPPVLFLSSVLL